MTLSNEARQARRLMLKKAQKKWRANNRDKVNAYNREWRKAHPDKVELYQTRYWEKKGAELEALRAADSAK